MQRLALAGVERSEESSTDAIAVLAGGRTVAEGPPPAGPWPLQHPVRPP